jgi:hypothetical protein
VRARAQILNSSRHAPTRAQVAHRAIMASGPLAVSKLSPKRLSTCRAVADQRRHRRRRRRIFISARSLGHVTVTTSSVVHERLSNRKSSCMDAELTFIRKRLSFVADQEQHQKPRTARPWLHTDYRGVDQSRCDKGCNATSQNRAYEVSQN